MKKILMITVIALGFSLSGCSSFCRHGGECSMHSSSCSSCAKHSQKCEKCDKAKGECADCKAAGSGECPMESKEAPKK